MCRPIAAADYTSTPDSSGSDERPDTLLLGSKKSVALGPSADGQMQMSTLFWSAIFFACVSNRGERRSPFAVGVDGKVHTQKVAQITMSCLDPLAK